jgi:F-type H+-transporting ATPase subunit epsilon
MASFTFELVSPEKVLFSGPVQSVVVPAAEGEMTVMANHAPAMATLKPGVVVVSEGSGAPRRIYVRGGFVDIAQSGLTILAEQALAIEDLKPEILAQDIANAQEDVADAKSDALRRDAQEKLDQLRELQAALIN